MLKLTSLTVFFLTLTTPFLGHSAPSELSFSLQGKPLKTMDLSGIKKTVKSQTVTFLEPHELVNKTYEGVSFPELLKKIYGEKLKNFTQVRFTCLDGFQPIVPLKDILEGKNFLSFRDTKSASFDIQKQGKTTPVGPFYLVWKHQMKGEALETHLQLYWPYQVKAVDLI